MRYLQFCIVMLLSIVNAQPGLDRFKRALQQAGGDNSQCRQHVGQEKTFTLQYGVVLQQLKDACCKGDNILIRFYCSSSKPGTEDENYTPVSGKRVIVYFSNIQKDHVTRQWLEDEKLNKLCPQVTRDRDSRVSTGSCASENEEAFDDGGLSITCPKEDDVFFEVQDSIFTHDKEVHISHSWDHACLNNNYVNLYFHFGAMHSFVGKSACLQQPVEQQESVYPGLPMTPYPVCKFQHECQCPSYGFVFKVDGQPMIERELFFDISFESVKGFKMWNDEPVSVSLKINNSIRNFWQFQIPASNSKTENFCIPSSCVADEIECTGLSAVCEKKEDEFHIAIDKAGRIVDYKVKCGDMIKDDKQWQVENYDFLEDCDIRGRTTVNDSGLRNLCKSEIQLTYRACYRWRTKVKQCFADIHFNFPETQCDLYKGGDKALTQYGGFKKSFGRYGPPPMSKQMSLLSEESDDTGPKDPKSGLPLFSSTKRDEMQKQRATMAIKKARARAAITKAEHQAKAKAMGITTETKTANAGGVTVTEIDSANVLLNNEPSSAPQKLAETKKATSESDEVEECASTAPTFILAALIGSGLTLLVTYGYQFLKKKTQLFQSKGEKGIPEGEPVDCCSSPAKSDIYDEKTMNNLAVSSPYKLSRANSEYVSSPDKSLKHQESVNSFDHKEGGQEDAVEETIDKVESVPSPKMNSLNQSQKEPLSFEEE